MTDLVTFTLSDATREVIMDRAWAYRVDADASEGEGAHATYLAVKDAPGVKAGFGYRYTVTAPRAGAELLARYLTSVGDAMSGGGFDPGDTGRFGEARAAFAGAKAIRKVLV